MCSAATVVQLLDCACSSGGAAVGAVAVTNSVDGTRLQLAVDLSSSGSFLQGVTLAVACHLADLSMMSDGCPDTSGYFVESIDFCPLVPTRQYCVDLHALGLDRAPSIAMALQVAYSNIACPLTGAGPNLAYLDGGQPFANCPAACTTQPPACLTAIIINKQSC
jgi:hypothetical protein